MSDVAAPLRPPVPPGTVIRRVPRSACVGWEEREGAYAHRTGRFFRVIGVRAGAEERVMLDQPEVGILAFLATDIDGATALLVQWKVEPGNVGLVQAAPTVQATRSNIDRAHSGLPVRLLDEVLDPVGRLADALGSEQGDRFLSKENRDILRRIDAPIPAGPGTDLPDHEWIGGQRLQDLLRTDLLLNTDARSVIASAPWEHVMASRERPFAALAELLGVDTEVVATSWRTGDAGLRDGALALLRRHDRDRPEAEVVPLDELRSFTIVDDGILDRDGARVLGWFDVTLPTREVPHWCQPLLEQTAPSRCVLVLSIEGGRVDVGLAASMEPGWTRAEFGPTLQVGHDDVRLAELEGDPLLDVVASLEQSDEGGRFFESMVRYEIAVWHGDRAALGSSVAWLPLGIVEELTRGGRTTTNELRSCLSLLLSYA